MNQIQWITGDHPVRIDKTDRTEENPEREKFQDLGNKMIPGIVATVVLQGTDILIITEKREDILQFPRLHQHLELITGI